MNKMVEQDVNPLILATPGAGKAFVNVAKTKKDLLYSLLTPPVVSEKMEISKNRGINREMRQ